MKNKQELRDRAVRLIEKAEIYKYQGRLRYRKLDKLTVAECTMIGENPELIYELAPEDKPRPNPFGLNAETSPPNWEP